MNCSNILSIANSYARTDLFLKFCSFTIYAITLDRKLMDSYKSSLRNEITVQKSVTDFLCSVFIFKTVETHPNTHKK